MYFIHKEKNMRPETRKLEDRLTALERQLQMVKSQLKAVKKASKKAWWEDLAGRFKNDPLFDEIAEAGQAYRKALARRAR
jgi:hypothetical protein